MQQVRQAQQLARELRQRDRAADQIRLQEERDFYNNADIELLTEEARKKIFKGFLEEMKVELKLHY